MPSMPSNLNISQNTPAVSQEVLTQAEEDSIEAGVQARSTILGLKRTRTISGSSLSGSLRGRGRHRTTSNSSSYSVISARTAAHKRRGLLTTSSLDVRNTTSLPDNYLRIPDHGGASRTMSVEIYAARQRYTSTSVEEDPEGEEIEDEAAINRCRRPRLIRDMRHLDYPTRLILDDKGKKLTTRSRSAATADEALDMPDESPMEDIAVWCDSGQVSPIGPLSPLTAGPLVTVNEAASNLCLSLDSQTTHPCQLSPDKLSLAEQGLISGHVHIIPPLTPESKQLSPSVPVLKTNENNLTPLHDAKSLRQSFKKLKGQNVNVEVSCL